MPPDLRKKNAQSGKFQRKASQCRFLPSSMQSPPAFAATRFRRFVAFMLNATILLVLLVAFARILPEAPPPANAMAFYSPQDFKNYFSLVAAALLLVTLGCAAIFLPILRATPGALLAGLQLVTFDSGPPSLPQVTRRWWSAVLSVAVLAVPGPLVALAVGVFLSMTFDLAFSTTDDILRRLQTPDLLRMSIHGLSFTLLGAALWWIAVRPAIRMLRSPGPYVSDIDRITSTTYVPR